MNRIFLHLFSCIIFLFLTFSCVTDQVEIESTDMDQEEILKTIQYSLKVSASLGGTVSTEGGTYDDGTQINIIATANDGYVLVDWNINGNSVGCQNSVDVKADENKSIVANFVLIDESLLKDGDYILINRFNHYDFENGYGAWMSQNDIESIERGYQYFYLGTEDRKFINREPNIRQWIKIKDGKIIQQTKVDKVTINTNNIIYNNPWRDVSIISDFSGESFEISNCNQIIVKNTAYQKVNVDGIDYPNERVIRNTKWELVQNENDRGLHYTNTEINQILREQSDYGIYADSIYRTIDPNDFNSIKNAFILDAKRNGLNISYMYDEELTIEVVDWNYGGAYGTPCVNGSIRMYWEDSYDFLLGLTTLNTLWHELGHAALNLAHVCKNQNDIMYSKNKGRGGEIDDGISCDVINVDTDFRRDYPLEWFKENARRMFQNVGQYEYECGFATQKNALIIAD